MAPKLNFPRKSSRRSPSSPYDQLREQVRSVYPSGTYEDGRRRKKSSRTGSGSRPPPGYPKPPKGYPRPPKGSGRPQGYGGQHNALVASSQNGRIVDKVQDKIMATLADPVFQEKAAKFLRDQAKKHFERRAARAGLY